MSALGGHRSHLFLCPLPIELTQITKALFERFWQRGYAGDRDSWGDS